MTENEISYKIIGSIYKVNTRLGPGLLEKVYEKALTYQLRKDGLKVETQVKVPIRYDGELLDMDLYIDLLVEDKVIIELKSVSDLQEVHYKQLYSYLKLTDRQLGLLVNFNTSDIKNSIRRVVCGLKNEA
jgi:GxxExxY protein